MTWIRIEAGFADHPKLRGLSAIDFRIHLAAMLWAAQHGTDGRVTADFVARCGHAPYRWKGPGRARFVQRMVDAGLWDEVAGGWKIHDWDHYQFPASETKRIPTSDAERARRYRQRKAEAASRNVTTRHERVTVHNGVGSTTQPNPVMKESVTVEPAGVATETEPEPRKERDGRPRPLADLIAYRPATPPPTPPPTTP